jgi:hypothetical protein
MGRGGQLRREKAQTLKLDSGNWAERRASRAVAISKLEGLRRSAETTSDEHAVLHKRLQSFWGKGKLWKKRKEEIGNFGKAEIRNKPKVK